MIGSTISHYKILEKLGEGGMGVVYKAEDTKLDRIVAIKFLPHHYSADKCEKKRFIREAKAASALDHSNICTIHEIDETEDGQLFIVMACCEGETLKQKIAAGPLKIEDAIEIATQIAQGLSRSHQHGIIHRDIKPANVVLTNDGVAKIVDFGLATLAGQTKVTKVGMTLGTIAYMSPEQGHGDKVDQRTDIWSLGIVLYEMITGRLPFKSEYEAAAMYSIMNEEPDPIASLRTDVPVELEQIVKRAMQKDQNKRYQHIEEMLLDLKSCRRTIEAKEAQPLPASRSLITHKRLSLFAWIAGVLVALGFFLYLLLLSKHEAVNRKSIAVLPFTNLSDSKEDEYFSDGVTEDIIACISKIGDLKVISRTSVMQYKGMKKSIREIGNELNVATVLEGSVRRAGNRIRIVGQLIDALTDDHLWTETYDRDLKDVFEIQSDIAQRMASALKAKLSTGEKERIEEKATENLEAYAFYLKGREYYRRYRKQDNENAITLYKKAIERDPQYALAYAGIGDAYCQRGDLFGSSNEWLDSAIAVSRRAIQLAPNLAEGYKALGHAFAARGWSRKALEQYRKAVELNPNYDDALANIGWTNLHVGQYHEAVFWLKRSSEHNPTLAFDYFGVGLAYMRLDDRDKAEWWLDRTLKLEPDFVYAQLALCYLDIAQQRYQHALGIGRSTFDRFPNEPDVIVAAADAELFSGGLDSARQYYAKAISIDSIQKLPVAGIRPLTRLGYIFWKIGNKNEARRLFSQSLRLDQAELAQGNDVAFVPYDVAALYAVQENQREALLWLQKAIDGGWRDYRFSLTDPLFEHVRSDEQFKQMMAQLKAKNETMRTKVEEMEKE